MPSIAAAAPASPRTGESGTSKPPTLTEAARLFEGILLQQMLRLADRPISGERMLDGGSAGRMYRELFLERVARLASERGVFGVARLLEAGISAPDGDATGGGR